MHSSNDTPKGDGADESLGQGDFSKDRQLELEIQAFAELLLDIYEYQYNQKREQTALPPTFDGGSEERKME